MMLLKFVNQPNIYGDELDYNGYTLKFSEIVGFCRSTNWFDSEPESYKSEHSDVTLGWLSVPGWPVLMLFQADAGPCLCWPRITPICLTKS